MGIADDFHSKSRSAQPIDDCKVGRIAVLRLVDNDLAEAGGKRRPNARGEVRVRKPFGYAQPNIVKVDLAAVPGASDDITGSGLPSGGVPRCCIEAQLSGTSGIDSAGPSVKTLKWKWLRRRKRLHLPIVLVGHQSRYRRAARYAERGNEELPQKAVKRTDEAREWGRRQQPEESQTTLKLINCGIGEGKKSDPALVVSSACEMPGPFDHRPGFASARTRRHKGRSVMNDDGFLLVGWAVRCAHGATTASIAAAM